MPLVYGELRRIAERHMRTENPGHTLQATALVHELYVRLVKTDLRCQDRVHFFAVAARQMRRILVDHARARRRQKRGGAMARVTLKEAVLTVHGPPTELLALDEAIDRLAQLDERKSRAVEMHFFAGLTYEEVAEALGVSEATVDRDLRMAKAWLHHELTSTPEAGQ